MNAELKRRLDLPFEEAQLQAATSNPNVAASAAIVNRTHRVVRERARNLQARRSLVRSLWLPLGLFSAFLIVICTALWTGMAEYELTPTEIPDASKQMFVLMIWCLPLSVVILALVLFRRFKAENGNAR